MEQSQLEEVMIYHVKNLSGTSDEITVDSVHSNYLHPAARGKRNRRRVYRDCIGFTISNAGQSEKPWPSEWINMTIRQLAEKIIIFLMVFLLPFISQSQVQVTIGAGKSDLRENILTIGVTYLKSFDSIWKHSNYRRDGKHSIFSVSPEFNMLTGTDDAFSSINLKAVGHLMTFKTTTVAGLVTPNTNALFHTFPFSIGVETNNQFNVANGIIEAGWVPWYQAPGVNIPEILKATSFGIFLQSGFKFSGATLSAPIEGGEIDQSQEKPEDFILRIKGSLDVDTKALLRVNGLKVGFVGGADAWYDAINSAIYHRIDLRGRFYLSDVSFIDIIYQKGSGAPNFNQGDQYGMGLTVSF